MLKDEFNKFISSDGSNPLKKKEVELFRALKVVLEKRHFVYIREMHGNKGLVSHKLNAVNSSGSEVKCEIADLLMLFIDERYNLRYTFLQNKRDKKIDYSINKPLRKVMADAYQWDLLHFRSLLTDSGTTGLPKNILSDAVLSSVATYGIFVNEKVSNTVDMSYNIARDLHPVSKRKMSHRGVRTYSIISDYNKVICDNGYFEIQGTTNLDDFEMAAQSMLVGAPLERNNKEHHPIAQVLISFAYSKVMERQNADGESNNRDVNYNHYLEVIRTLASLYEVNLEKKQEDLPYDLVIMTAKRPLIVSSSRFKSCYHKSCLECMEYSMRRRNYCCCNYLQDCTILNAKHSDHVLSLLTKGIPLIFTEPNNLVDDIKLYLTINDTNNCYVVDNRNGSLYLINAYKYFNSSSYTGEE